MTDLARIHSFEGFHDGRALAWMAFALLLVALILGVTVSAFRGDHVAAGVNAVTALGQEAVRPMISAPPRLGI
jgi:hypothetical protein